MNKRPISVEATKTFLKSAGTSMQSRIKRVWLSPASPNIALFAILVAVFHIFWEASIPRQTIPGAASYPPGFSPVVPATFPPGFNPGAPPHLQTFRLARLATNPALSFSLSGEINRIEISSNGGTPAPIKGMFMESKEFSANTINCNEYKAPLDQGGLPSGLSCFVYITFTATKPGHYESVFVVKDHDDQNHYTFLVGNIYPPHPATP